MPVKFRETRVPQWEIIAAFAFGVCFLSMIFVTAFFRPEPTAFQYKVFVIIISLAAGGVGAILPGFLNLNYKGVVRAGGALALFLLVYFGSPAALSPVMAEPPEVETDPQTAILHWFEQMDSGDYQEAYKSTSLRFQKQYTLEQYKTITKRNLEPLGKKTSRLLISSNFAQSPPGAPAGRYQYNVYESKYSLFPKPIYVSVSVIGEKNEWRVFGYNLGTKNDSGQFIPYEPQSPSLLPQQ